MSFSIGIIGLPNAGKSTLFKALTKKEVEIAPYAFTTRDPNIGIVSVPDIRLKKIAEKIKPQKITPTFIKFVDIAGLVKGAHKGEGLGNQFLAHIRNCDAVVEVVRAFENAEIEHVEGSVEPKRDIDIIKTELLMKDLEILEKCGLFPKIKEQVSQDKLISEMNLSEEEKLAIKEYQFLTEKPRVFVFNVSGGHPDRSDETLSLDLKLEEELSELSEAEAEELGMDSQLDKLITACYNILDLITFFTVTGGKETRAWTLKKDSKVFEAAGYVHSDFAEKFIKAEVIPWQQLVEAQSWTGAREKGWLRTEGKEYIVKDGDVIEFKI